MGKALPEDKNETPTGASAARLDLRPVTMVLYQRGLFPTRVFFCFFFNVVNHYELNKLQEELQDPELESMLT